MLLMGAIAVAVGFVIGGGFSLFTGGETALDTGTAASSTTTASTTSTSAAPAEPTTTAAPPPVRPPAEVAVRVYNGSSRAGQAVRVGDRLKAAGYNVLTPGPSPKDPIATSVVQYAEGFDAEARALATSLGVPESAAVPAPDPATVAGIGPATVVLVVGEDLATVE
jgi:hypothetical protein